MRPNSICICHDEEYANLIGRTNDRKQFFITQPFIPYGKDFVARYVFDEEGRFHDAKIYDLGLRTSGEPPGNPLFENQGAKALQQELLDELGAIQFCDIFIQPFSYELHGINFGLVANILGDGSEDWRVTAEPGNYMEFYAPWDGEYYT
ncbi:hypothetical protein BH11VER1_BH11VER1_20840 [soil metagenome]